jgi:GntR family transcriptional regulator/MocR family aminotransferase
MAVPVEAFHLAPGEGGTLQSRIRAMVARGILAGRFRPGARLPSSRALAVHLGVSRITVTLAYADLVASDYLVARGRSGYFVSETAPGGPDFAPEGPRAVAVDYAALTGRRYSAIARPEKPVDWERYPYPFIYGQADPALFDHHNWRQCALRALGRREFSALTSDQFERDDPMLIDMLRGMILPRRGIAAAEDEVLLTLGAQNALWIAASLLLRPGRVAVVETPGYPGLAGMVAQTGAALRPVAVDAEGLPPEAAAGADVIFTTASHQCPTNATMPIARRIALLEGAARAGAVVVEDDYEFEMSFLGPVAPALKSLDAEGRVIHVGSFSKSVFPGLRLGYLVAPRDFIAEARALRALMLRHPPGLIQRTTAHFLALGHYDALVNRMRQAFRRRRQAMSEAIAAQGLRVAGQGGFGGSSFWMEAPEGTDTGALALRLRGQGVLIEPGQVFFPGPEAPRRFYRLAYSSIQPARIPEGIARIAQAL